MRPHTTHHDDCGCKSARYEETIAELLEALDDLLIWLDVPGDHCETENSINRARAAIEKEKGESK